MIGALRHAIVQAMRAPDEIRLSDPPVTVRLRVSARARRFTLRLAHGEASAILTLPPGVPFREAEQFVHRQAGWLARALDRRPAVIDVVEGATLPVAGAAHRIRRHPGARGAPFAEAGALVVPGSGPVGPRVRAWLRERARAELVECTALHAGVLGRTVRGVALRDTRSRWGSCSAAGRISYSWRLAMAPQAVLDYVAAHEAAHLVEMNHGPRFWSLVAELCPDHAAHRGWLRTVGPSLHAYRFDAP